MNTQRGVMNMTETHVSLIEQTYLPEIERHEGEVRLEIVDGVAHVIGAEEMLESIQSMIDQVDQYEYHPDDRQSIKKLRAATNKMSAAFTSQINTHKKSMFEQADAQKKELSAALATLVNKLSTGIEEEDRLYKANKRQEISDMFDDAKSSYDVLAEVDDLELDHVFVPAWLNRSTSMKQVTTQLADKMKTLNTLYASDVNPIKETETIVDILRECAWDGLTALSELINEEKLREEEAELQAAREQMKREAEERRQQEIEAKRLEKEAEANKRFEVSIDVIENLDAKSWLKLKSVLDDLDATYQVKETN